MHVIWIYIIVRYICVPKQLRRGHKFSEFACLLQPLYMSSYLEGVVWYCQDNLCICTKLDLRGGVSCMLLFTNMLNQTSLMIFQNFYTLIFFFKTFQIFNT